jgi:hypothetical protein
MSAEGTLREVLQLFLCGVYKCGIFSVDYVDDFPDKVPISVSEHSTAEERQRSACWVSG